MQRPAERPRIDPWTLHFDPPNGVEEEFEEEFLGGSRWPIRATLVLAMAIYLSFGFVDVRLFPDEAAEFIRIRLEVAVLAAVILGISWLPQWERLRGFLLASALLGAAIGLVSIFSVGPPRTDLFYYVGFVLIIVAAHTIFRLHFVEATLVSIAVVAIYDVGIGLTGEISWALVLNNNLFLVSAAAIGGFASYGIERYARIAFLDRKAIEAERARSEELLLNVLPARVADRLKEEEGPIADAFPSASILFADLVDFAGLSAALTPGDLVRMLNRVFTTFDQICAERSVEKIKTIGDSYMAVAGVPVPRSDHAERIAETALAMRDAAAPWATEDPAIRVRIGIASGPVVAGVIGEQKFSYDLWGEPVTAASRMQAHGMEGRIQVTERFANALDDRYRFERRGEIEIKGMGRMVTYWLEGKAGDGGALSRPAGGQDALDEKTE